MFRTKEELLKFITATQKKSPDSFVQAEISASIIDQKNAALLQELWCSLDIPLEVNQKNGVLLFDKKLYSSKAKILNDAGLVFGFVMKYGQSQGDTFKAFRDRLDFATSLYPNHIVFPQLDESELPPSTAVFSSKDMDFARGIAFACRTFYTAGRAVSWFNTILGALKINPSSFFADFDEWQQCNNCSYVTDFIPEDHSHEEIEKMQLNFLKEKFDEKHKNHLFPAACDMVKLNGAFSRLAAENEESEVETSYNPEDILSPYAMNLASFTENVTMENCRVKIFFNQDEPDFKIL
ncbi:hypothetical protein [Treponema sp.]|uniref:hypothetical protein n=1 Tax=Treponema sp. TaxID=166 RepID=UPI0025E4C74B|nr:hypothetical protein [Treponema sp.]MCR5218914.1 hypothetical protein [Treponema sp.]